MPKIKLGSAVSLNLGRERINLSGEGLKLVQNDSGI